MEETNFFASGCAAAFAGKVKVKLGVLRLVDVLAASNCASPVEDLPIERQTYCYAAASVTTAGHDDGGGVRSCYEGVFWKGDEGCSGAYELVESVAVDAG